MMMLMLVVVVDSGGFAVVLTDVSTIGVFTVSIYGGGSGDRVGGVNGAIYDDCTAAGVTTVAGTHFLFLLILLLA